VRPLGGLVSDGGVPPGIVVDHRVGGREVQPPAPGSQADREQRHFTALERTDRFGTITRVTAQFDEADARRGQAGLDQVEYRGELREQQDAAPLARRTCKIGDGGRPRPGRSRTGSPTGSGNPGPVTSGALSREPRPCSLSPVMAIVLCRRRLPRARIPQVCQSCAVTGEGGDRQALGPGEGVRRLAQTLGGGANARVAEPLPSARQGLGKPQSQGAGISADGIHSPHGQEAMPRLAMFPDRL